MHRTEYGQEGACAEHNMSKMEYVQNIRWGRMELAQNISRMECAQNIQWDRMEHAQNIARTRRTMCRIYKGAGWSIPITEHGQDGVCTE